MTGSPGSTKRSFFDVPRSCASLRATSCALNGALARSIRMLDILMLAIGLVFFALSVGYAVACDRL
jgi:hypothetical protein